MMGRFIFEWVIFTIRCILMDLRAMMTNGCFGTKILIS